MAPGFLVSVSGHLLKTFPATGRLEEEDYNLWEAMNVFFLPEAAFSISSYFEGTWESDTFALVFPKIFYHLPYLSEKANEKHAQQTQV